MMKGITETRCILFRVFRVRKCDESRVFCRSKPENAFICFYFLEGEDEITWQWPRQECLRIFEDLWLFSRVTASTVRCEVVGMNY